MQWIHTDLHFWRTWWEKSRWHAVIYGHITETLTHHPHYDAVHAYGLSAAWQELLPCPHWATVPRRDVGCCAPGVEWPPFHKAGARAAWSTWASFQEGFSRHLHLVSFLGHEIQFHFNFKWLKLCKNTIRSRKKVILKWKIKTFHFGNVKTRYFFDTTGTCYHPFLSLFFFFLSEKKF